MAALRRNVLIGTGWSVKSITPMTIDADGVTLIAGTTKDLTGRLERMAQTYRATTAIIQALDKAIANHVITMRDTSFRIEEQMESTTPGSVLGDISISADIFKVIVTRAGKTYTYYGVATDYEEPMEREKHVATLVLQQIDIGAANPAYA